MEKKSIMFFPHLVVCMYFADRDVSEHPDNTEKIIPPKKSKMNDEIKNYFEVSNYKNFLDSK